MNASFDFPSLLDDLAGPIGLKLALALLHFLWQGVLIAAVAAVLTRLVGRRSSQRRYLIGVAGMALMAVAPIATFCFVTPPEPPPVEPVPIVDASELLVDLEQFDAFLTTLDVPPVEAPAVAPPAVRLSWPERLRLIQPYAVLLWLAGSLLCGLRLVIGAHSSLKCRRGRRAVPEAWLDIVAKAAGRIGIKSPSVFVSDRVAEAIAVGLLRPMVLLPAAWIGRIPPDVLEAVLAHELSHLRRYDLWVNLFQRIVESVLFYHPAVWWLSRRVRLEREYCCDETAAEAVAGRAAYARALEYVATERVAGGRTELFQAALAAGMRGEDSMALLNRVHRVLGNDNRPRRTPRLSEGLLALAVPVALWAGIATVGPALAQENDTQDSADTASHETEVEAVEDKQPAVSDELLAFNFGHGGPDGSWRLLAHPDTGIGATYRKLSVSPQSLEHSLTEEERSRLAEKLRRDIDRRDESLPPLENFIRALHGREPAFETRADDESQKLSPTFQVAFRGPSGEFIVRLFRQNGRLDFYRRDDTALASLGDRSRRVIAAMLDQKARKRPEAVPTNIDEIIAYLGGAPIAYTDESDGHREKSDALRELREELKSLRSEVEELRSGRVEPRTSLPIVHKSKEDLWQDYMSAIKARDEAYGRILRLEKSQAEDPAYERFAQERYREAENHRAELHQRIEQVDSRLFERMEGPKYRVVTDLVESEDGKTRQFKRLVPIDAKLGEPSDDRRSPDADGFQPLVDPAAKPHTVYELEVIPNRDGKTRYVPRTRIRNTPPPHMEESLSGPPVIVQRVVKLRIDGKEVPVVVEETRDTPNGQAKEIHLRLLKKAKDGTPVYPNPQPENDEKPDDAAQKEASAEIKQLVEEYRQAVKSRDEAARLAASEAQSGRNLAHSQNRLVEAQRELERVQAELERRKILAGLTVGELNAPGDDEPKEASAEVKQLVEEYRQAVKSRDEAARLAAAEAAKGVAPSQKWLVEAQRKLEQIQAELERRKILVGLPVDDAAPAEQMPSDEAAYLRVYPVGDFIASGPDVKKPVTGMLDTLVNLISRSIRPSSWEEAGGKGRIQKDEKELKLLITQTKDGHEEIADLLKTLKALQGERSGDDEPAEADVTKALEKPVSLHFEKTPLEHVLATLRNIAGVNFVIDKAGLDEEGVTLETPVSINVDDMAIRNVLSTILSPLNLTATTDDGVVVITSRQRAKGPLVVETYPVGDLVLPRPQPNKLLGGRPTVELTSEVKTQAAARFDNLIDLITANVEPGSWEIVGGQGVLRQNDTTLSLVIRQTRDVHDEIADLLEQLRRLQSEEQETGVRVPDKINHKHKPPAAAPEPESATTASKLSTPTAGTATEDKKSPTPDSDLIRDALTTPISLNVSDIPLRDVVALIRSQADVNIVFDAKGLRAGGVTPDTPISSMNFKDIPLGGVLRMILEPMALTAVAEDGVIKITSIPPSQQKLTVQTYAVPDLVLPVPQGNIVMSEDGELAIESSAEKKQQVADRFENLIDVITANVQLDSWEQFGGQGVIRKNDAMLCLVVRQTQDAHNEIRSLLEKLRKMRRSDSDAVLEPEDKINRKHFTPKAAAADAAEETASVKVRVQQSGTYYVDGYAASATGLASAIKEAMADGDQTELVIQADRSAPFSAVARVIEAAKEIGVDKIRFASEPAASPNEDLSGETSDNEAKQDDKTAIEWDKLVSEYNELIDQRNFAEALTIAKKVRELDPENLTGVTMLYKAKVLLEETRQPSPDRHISTEALLDSTSAIEPVPGATDGMSNRADGPSSHDTGGRSPVPAVAYGPIVYGSKNLPRKLLEVRVEGNRTVPTKSILEDVEMSPGQQLSSDRIAEDTRRLLRTRRFLSVTPRITSTDGGAIVTFEVVERPYDRADSAMPDDEDETTNGASLDRSFRGVGQLFQLATQDLLLHEELQPVAGEVVQIVSTASGDDQILITPGSNAGLRKGATVEVFHDNDYVAKLELTSVEEALSLGRVIRRAKNMEIRQGDRVSIGP